MMKQILNWEKREVVNIFDEVTLWSAPFGRLLLENIPMTRSSNVVDIGFGTGFPLIELSQRFGSSSKIYGIDIWTEGIERARDKIKVLELDNIEIIEESAAKIKLPDNQIDLVTSNLGVNNFAEKEEVYQEIKRILKRGGRLCLTTNPIGTFEELFELFYSTLHEMKLEKELILLEEYIQHRNTEKKITSELEKSGFTFIKSKFDTTNMRFVEAAALLNHSLIRIGFRESWQEMMPPKKKTAFFEQLLAKIESSIESKGEFKITIPMLYLEFEKE